MNHTPGPWIIGHNLRKPDLHLSVHEQDGGWTIANCDMRIRPTAQNEANARLIAIAPDLLEACNAALEWVAKFPLCGDASMEDRMAANYVFRTCNAAIAKMKGQDE